MIFWIAVAVLAAAVTYAVTRPLGRARDVGTTGQAGLAVYKDQLSEIDSDRARGILSDTEAEAARTEIARRVLRQVDDDKKVAVATKALPERSTLPVFYAAWAAIPALSLALYLSYGAPGKPGQPLSERLAAKVDTAQTNDLVAKVEARLREHPDDGKGWDVIAPVYMAQGSFAEAADAYASAMKYLGESAKRLEGFSVARIRASNGLVPEDAKKSLNRALELEPKKMEPRIWLGLAKEQEGDIKGAVADYQALLNAGAPEAPWRKAVEDRLSALQAKPADEVQAKPAAEGQSNSVAEPGKSEPGKVDAPAAPDAAAVAGMAPEAREQMINKMVEGLAARLKTNGNDLTGWLKLVRAYSVLGRNNDAANALSNARKQFASDAKSLAELNDLAKSLGLGS